MCQHAVVWGVPDSMNIDAGIVVVIAIVLVIVFLFTQEREG
jgi:hypothetical protein